MELFAVSLQSCAPDSLSGLIKCLSEEFNGLRKRANGSVVHWQVDEGCGLIRCLYSAKLPEAFRGEAVYRKAAAAIAEYILNEMEPVMLGSIARKEFHYENADELKAIAAYCKHILEDGDGMADRGSTTAADHRKRRKQRIADELTDYLLENKRLNLDGYVTFRMNVYWEELRGIVEFADQEFTMDKQYREFISLLRYFVGVQDAKVPLVHVFHRTNTEFHVCDERLRDMDPLPSDPIVAEMLEMEMNVEDLIVSTLINMSPQRIVLHTRQPFLPVVRTIETIFEGRVKLCVSCATCIPKQEGSRKPLDLHS